MRYAIIESGGKQFIARQGETIEVDRLPLDEGDAVTFDQVLLVADDGKVNIGRPFLKGATVKGKVIGQIKAPKIIVYKYIPKEHYRRKQGHRQRVTRVAIERILLREPRAKKAESEEQPKKPSTRSKSTRAATKSKQSAKPAGGRRVPSDKE